MADDKKIAVYENGELTVPVKGNGGNEAILALPLDRLLVKILKIPSDIQEDPIDYVANIFKQLSPFPDESLKVSYEVIREDEDGRIVLAAALPEGSVDDIAEALDSSKLNVTRVDSLVLGTLRSAWPNLAIGNDSSRRLVFITGSTCISLFVFDGDCPVVIRAISPGSDIKRETMLSLIEAESFAGPLALSEAIIIGEMDTEGIASFAPHRTIDSSLIDTFEGIAERADDNESLNALPDSWREFLEETRFKAKFKRFLALAMMVWGLMVAVIIGVPKYYDYKTDQQKKISRSHRDDYETVCEMKSQVESLESASNYSQGALESLRVIADYIPEGFVLKNWSYDKAKSMSLRFSGSIADDNYVSVNNTALEFKDILSAVDLSIITENEDDSERLFFAKVNPPSVKPAAKGNVNFSYECLFNSDEEVE